MKTRLPISSISYNTPAFLRQKLEELRKAKILSEWYFIEHEPEDDEAGNKKHIHLWAVPSKQLQTDDLQEEFLEPDPAHEKPRKCMAFRSSKEFADWYLYSIHDIAYLASKGQSRKYHYTVDQMQAFDRDELNRRVHEIDLLDNSPYRKLVEYAKEGLTWKEVFMRGSIPIQQIKQWEEAYRIVRLGQTFRNGRKGHDEPDEWEPSGVEWDDESTETLSEEDIEFDPETIFDDDVRALIAENDIELLPVSDDHFVDAEGRLRFPDKKRKRK